jgi:hypothetical protein
VCHGRGGRAIQPGALQQCAAAAFVFEPPAFPAPLPEARSAGGAGALCAALRCTVQLVLALMLAGAAPALPRATAAVRLALAVDDRLEAWVERDWCRVLWVADMEYEQWQVRPGGGAWGAVGRAGRC